MTTTNGHAPQITKPPSVEEVRNFMKSFINPIMVGAVNGILHSLSQIPIEESIVMTCAMFGRMIGNTLSIGELAPVLGLRKKCLDAFADEMRKVTIRPIPPGVLPSSAETKELLSKLKGGAT